MKKIEEKSKFYKALGELIRLKIIHYLLKKECICICELANFIKRDQSVIFRHIEILEEVGIVNTRKEKKYLMCCVKNKKEIRKYLGE